MANLSISLFNYNLIIDPERGDLRLMRIFQYVKETIHSGIIEKNLDFAKNETEDLSSVNTNLRLFDK